MTDEQLLGLLASKTAALAHLQATDRDDEVAFGLAQAIFDARAALYAVEFWRARTEGREVSEDDPT